MANEGFKKVLNGKYYIGYGYIIEKDPRCGWTTYNIFKEEDVKKQFVFKRISRRFLQKY